jgi:probable HAF family extracellular repeat protein
MGLKTLYKLFCGAVVLAFSLGAQAQCINTETPTCGVYETCFAKLCPCSSSPDEYFLSYGKKYCDAFIANDKLSPKGIAWRNATLHCLQETIVPKLPPFGQAATCPCKAVQQSAFDSHVACYTQDAASICDLSTDDWGAIIESSGLLRTAQNEKVRRQVAGVLEVCLDRVVEMDKYDLVRWLLYKFDKTKIKYKIHALDPLGQGAAMEIAGLGSNIVALNHGTTSGAYLVRYALDGAVTTLAGVQPNVAGVNLNGTGYGFVGKRYSLLETAAIWNTSGQLTRVAVPDFASSAILGGDGKFTYVGVATRNSADGGKQDTAFKWRDQNNNQAIDAGELSTLGNGASFPVAGTVNAEALAVNGAGLAVGIVARGEVRGVMWNQDSVVDLGHLGYPSTTPRAINAAGEICGNSDLASGATHAFAWKNGKMRDLGTLGGTRSVANDINSAGVIVGWATTPQGKKRAVLWLDDTIVDLNSYFPADSGWILDNAKSIDNAGNITGYGTYRGKSQLFVLSLIKK